MSLAADAFGVRFCVVQLVFTAIQRRQGVVNPGYLVDYASRRETHRLVHRRNEGRISSRYILWLPMQLQTSNLPLFLRSSEGPHWIN
jgi:hypothetical protein